MVSINIQNNAKKIRLIKSQGLCTSPAAANVSSGCYIVEVEFAWRLTRELQVNFINF